MTMKKINQNLLELMRYLQKIGHQLPDNAEYSRQYEKEIITFKVQDNSKNAWFVMTEKKNYIILLSSSSIYECKKIY